MAGYPVDSNCLFCKIIAGKIPSHTLFQNDKVFAFLDIMPLSRGHCLVIPKGHFAKLDELPEDVAAACGAILPRLSHAVKTATGVTDWNLLQNNGAAAHQVVGHVHFHLIPKPTDNLDGGTGLGIQWPAGKLDATEGAELSRKIAAELRD